MMIDNIIERLRKKVVDDLFSTSSFGNCWSVWGPAIQNLVGANPTPQSILDLGDNLRGIFQTTGSTGRDQSELSGGGAAWESLITWYVNLCCVNTRVVAVKKMGQVPTPIKDAITVNYANFSCTTESDITVIVFPDSPVYTQPNPSLLKRNGSIDNNALSAAVATDFFNFEVGIIQCKTNWNDNAQIPMLWDMIYSAGGFRGRQISVGHNNYSIQALGPGFTYSFVTVPSVRLSNFTPTSLCVKRVYNLSGGNFWGLPTRNGVARSVKEIFQNYINGYEHRNIMITLNNAIPFLHNHLNYFRI